MMSAFTPVTIKDLHNYSTISDTKEEISFSLRHSLQPPSELLIAKRESKNRDAAQQSFLFKLLARHNYEIRLTKLYKDGKTMNQLFKVEQVIKQGEIKFDSNWLSIHSEHSLKKRRRYQDALTNNWLMNILEKECGVKFEIKKGRKVTNPENISMKRISSIINGSSMFNSTMIYQEGIEYNNYIKAEMKKTKEKCFVCQNFPMTNECISVM
ncbi:Uncharacterized protein QTN25_007790 [Entamoeba marina]